MSDEQLQPLEPENKLEEELKEYKDKYLRSLAEMENARKRMQKDKQEMIRFSIENALADLLPPIDNLENALNVAENMSQEIRHWAKGFEMILGQFKEVLSTNGVQAFSSVGAAFDPNLHQAIEIEETDLQPEGTILQEFAKGYKCGERTIRPARVKVAKAPALKEEEQKI